MPKINLKQARRLAIHCALLDKQANLPKGKEGVAEVINRLGYIQVDTINIINRAHLHTLWTRLPDFKPEYLYSLQKDDRAVFEYWGHAMSYLPMSDYRYYQPEMLRFKGKYEEWVLKRLSKYENALENVYNRIKKEGPLSSKDFKPLEKRTGSGWWDWKPAKVALEYLFWQGKLMIDYREKFQRYYNLTDRVVPNKINKRMPSESKLGEFLILRALNSHGISTRKEIIDHLDALKISLYEPALLKLLKSKKVVEVTVGNLPDTYYAIPEILDKVSELPASRAMHILSPFDNVCILRERIKKLFDFEYSIECYVPAPKRKYGYFVLPLLYGDNFVGRIDCKAERKKRELVIKSFHIEPGFTVSEQFKKAFLKKVSAFAAFNGCDSISVEKVYPASLASGIKKLVR